MINSKVMDFLKRKPNCKYIGHEMISNKHRGMHLCNDPDSEYVQCELNLEYNCCPRGFRI